MVDDRKGATMSDGRKPGGNRASCVDAQRNPGEGDQAETHGISGEFVPLPSAQIRA